MTNWTIQAGYGKACSPGRLRLVSAMFEASKVQETREFLDHGMRPCLKKEIIIIIIHNFLTVIFCLVNANLLYNL